MSNNNDSGSYNPRLPKWQCHKVVQASKIIDVVEADGPMSTAYLVVEDSPPIAVSDAYMRKHAPKVGGYLVVYEHGYMSWSPADVFEAGYTRIDSEEA